MCAQADMFWGMTKDDVARRFASEVTSQGPNGLTLRTQFYGRDAEVYLGFVRDGKVGFIEVSFSSSKDKNRLTLFREIRTHLEGLSGRQYSYARIEGVDVLGESGGWVPDPQKSNALVFGTTIKGLVYQVEIFGRTVGDLTRAGDIKLTIDKEESIQAPNGPRK